MFKRFSSIFTVLLIGFFISTPCEAVTPEEKGLALAKQRKSQDTGWGDSQAQMKMVLRNATGQESIRMIRSKSLEVIGDGDKGLTIFDKPADVKGTAFLNFSHIDKADDQWLFLPALKRVKRINSRNKSGPFMGSEFSYEDLNSFEVKKYTYRYLREESMAGMVFHVIESFPEDRFSGYTRLVTYLDKEHLRVFKTDFFDRKNALLKTLKAEDFRLYMDKYWRPHVLEVFNHQTKKSTRLEFETITFNTGLSDRDFNKNSLKRAR